MSKCAKFHVDVPHRYRLKFIPVSAIELSYTANFGNIFFTENKCKRPTFSEDSTNFPFELFMQFSHNIPLYFSCHDAKKVKKGQKVKSGGGGGPGLKSSKPFGNL